MSKRAYFKFYPREFFGDTYKLTPVERDCYLKLLSQMFIDAKPIELDFQIMGQICSVSCTKMKRIWIKIEMYFIENDGVFYNEKMALQIDQIIEKSKKASKAAHQRWDKNGDANAYANASENAMPPSTNNQVPIKKKKIKASNAKKMNGKKPSDVAPFERGNQTKCIKEVFEHWQLVLNHGKAKLDNKRSGLINRALKSYNIDELKRAIDGCKSSAFHMGENEVSKKYDQISLIFRDSEHIENFMSLASDKKTTQGVKYI